jgi:hypothetical protein
MIALLARLFTRGEPALSEAGADDAAAIATLHGASFRQGWSEDEVERLLTDRGVYAHRAMLGRQLVGFILSRVAANEAEILSVAIAATHKRRGLVSRLVIENGRFTGDVHRPICYGAGKIHWAHRFAAEHDVDLAQSWFYTDSVTDLPMLELVGHPEIVNPDPRLRREARRRGWHVLELGNPERTREMH